MPNRAAIYARVSTSDQSADMQLAELREHATRRGWQVTGVYIDHGSSGTKSSRPELDKMMADARRRRFDLVVCWRFDRFARSTGHLLAALEEFRGLGIDFVSLNEAIDTTTPLGRMVFTVVAAVAELERSIIVERVKAGVARARANGKVFGRPRGSKIDSAEVHRLMSSGMSTRQVASKLQIGIGSVFRAEQAFQKTLPETMVAPPMSRRRN